ncbi:MAG: outer membrane protein assembly factor BamD [Bdellovibrionota bacterium]
MQVFRLVTATVLFFSILFFSACASAPSGGNDAAGLFAQGEKALQEENYLTALEKFRAVKHRYPYSSRAVEAELRIADTLYAQEAFVESEAAYEIFREMHPTHPKIDYVQYRIALSFFYQIPDNSARDLTAAYRAVDEFDVLISKYPKSGFVEEAKKRMTESRQKLAEHEEYVANFYFARQHYLSSSYRYASLLKNYLGLGYDEKALYRLGVCYYHTRMFSNSREALQRLLREFPESGFKGEAVALMKRLDNKETP